MLSGQTLVIDFIGTKVQWKADKMNL